MAEPQKPVEPAPSSTAAEAATETQRAEEAPAVEPQSNNKFTEVPFAQPTKEGVPGEAKRESVSEKKDVIKRRSSKEGAAKRKSTRKSTRGDEFDDAEEEIEEVPKIIYPIDEKIQHTLRTAWTLLVKKNQKKKTEISEAQVSSSPRPYLKSDFQPFHCIEESRRRTYCDAVYRHKSYGIANSDSHCAKSQDLATCSKGFLTYENFEQRVAETLQLQPELWIRRSREEILAALHTICEYKDQIEAEKFKKLLMTKGDVLTDPEGSMMLRVARDRDTRMVYLDEYVNILSKDAIFQPPPDPTVW